MGPATWAEGVSSAEDALWVFEQEPLDLVLSDVVMPEVDGPALVARLRAKGKATRFLLMSGYAGDALDRRCDPVAQVPQIARAQVQPAAADEEQGEGEARPLSHGAHREQPVAAPA